MLTTTALADQRFEFAPFEIPERGRIVVPISEGNAFSGIASNIDQRTNGALTRAAAEAGFTGESGSTLTLLGISPYSRVDLIGIGAGPVDRVAAENFGGTASALLGDTAGGNVQILWPDEFANSQATAARVALGFRLRSYRFDGHKAEPVDRSKLPVVRVLGGDGSGDEFENDLAYLADGVFFARNMSSEPANIIYPQSFVERAREAFRGLKNVTIRVLDEEDIQRLNMGALWGVGKGSSRPPRLLIIEYMAGGNQQPVVLAGKGITFDSGGISIKSNENMWMMKGDLGGAGVVTGTVLSAARRGAPINVVALAALAENMPSGTASRPGDLLSSMSGITIEISSTDAEGRLVLSDAVYYGQVTYEPGVLIDVATLTRLSGSSQPRQLPLVRARGTCHWTTHISNKSSRRTATSSTAASATPAPVSVPHSSVRSLTRSRSGRTSTSPASTTWMKTVRPFLQVTQVGAFEPSTSICAVTTRNRIVTNATRKQPCNATIPGDRH